MSNITNSDLAQSVTENIKASIIATPRGLPSSPNHWLYENLSAPLQFNSPANNWLDVDISTLFPDLYKSTPYGIQYVFGTLTILDNTGGTGLAEAARQPWWITSRPMGLVGTGSKVFTHSLFSSGLTKRSVSFNHQFPCGPFIEGGALNGRGFQFKVNDTIGGYTRLGQINVTLQTTLWIPY